MSREHFRVPLRVLSTQHNHNRRDIQNNYMQGFGKNVIKWMYGEHFRVPLHVLSTQHNHNRLDMHNKKWKALENNAIKMDVRGAL